MKKLFVICLLMLMSISNVYANSSQKYFEGTDSNGVFIVGESSPLVVNHEKLVFDIPEFPKEYYKEVEEYLGYDASVTAEYEVYNPSSYLIEARLLFPFGNTSDYGEIYDEDKNIYYYHLDTDKYNITVDGNNIDKVLRHTFKLRGDEFDLEDDLSMIVDGYKEDDYYYRDLLVTKYSYEVESVDIDEYADILFYYNNSDNVRIYSEDFHSFTMRDDTLELGNSSLKIGDKFSVYIIGDYNEESFEYMFYDKDKNIINGTLATIKEEMTFEEFALSEYNESSNILKYDWYNAVIDGLNTFTVRDFLIGSEFDLKVSNNLLRWYDYTIKVEPQETIINTVTAPIYPSLDIGYQPPIYEYTYLLSPAKTWEEFGSIDIEIHTDYYLLENNIEGFEKNNGMYTLSLEGLPDEELVFSLSEDSYPIDVSVNVFKSSSIQGIIIIGLVIAGFIILMKKGHKKMS